MKKSKKGFILAETIVVSTVVISALVIIYTQFISIINSYSRSFKYDSVEDMYAVNNINKYIVNDGYEELKLALNSNNYVDITDCSTDYFTEYLYCRNLMEQLNVKKAIFTKEDITNLTVGSFDEGLKKYIKAINSDLEPDRYRVIVEFNDNTYSSVKVK